MRCKTCDYALWNLRSRTCPECGAPFRPSEFEFVCNSVRFCCPHCGQDYYGTGEHGHLVPAEFACVRCGRWVRLDEMVVLPAEGVSEEQTRVDRMPWLERARLGRVKAWFATVFWGLFQPGRLIGLTPETSSAGQALWFATVCALVFGWGAGSVVLVAMGLVLGLAGGGGGLWALMPGLMLFAATALWIVLGAGVWGLLAHGVLRLTGPTAGGLGRTYQAIGYSTGANVVCAVPCLGFYLAWLGWLWWAASAGIMLAVGQRVSWWRATLAAAVFPLLSFATIVLVFVLPMYFAVSNAQVTATPTSAPGSPWMPGVLHNADRVLGAVCVHADANGGAGPGHAMELVASGALSGSDFILVGSGTRPDAVPVGATTLDRVPFAGAEARRILADSLTAALPGDVVAHRVGDYVFTYHGMDLRSADPELWVLIAWPDPAQNPEPVPWALAVHVGRAGRTTQAIAGHRFDAALAEQNALRVQRGLPPLPHPRLVTHEQPASAGSNGPGG